MLSGVKLILLASCCVTAKEPVGQHRSQEARVARALDAAPWDKAPANSWAQSSSKAAKAWERDGTADSSWDEDGGAGEAANTWDNGQVVRRDREVATSRQVGQHGAKFHEPTSVAFQCA